MSSTDRIISAFLRRVLLRMKELGLNQSSLAKRLNISRPYVSKLLHGDVNISFGAALRLAHALQMDFIPTLTPIKQSKQSKQSNNQTILPWTSSPR